MRGRRPGSNARPAKRFRAGRRMTERARNPRNLLTPAALRKGFGNRVSHFNARRNLVDFMRIDDESAIKLLRGAGELRQHQNAGILGILCSDILLATRFIPSRSGVTRGGANTSG
jgi:hypothetical protein